MQKNSLKWITSPIYMKIALLLAASFYWLWEILVSPNIAEKVIDGNRIYVLILAVLISVFFKGKYARRAILFGHLVLISHFYYLLWLNNFSMHFITGLVMIVSLMAISFLDVAHTVIYFGYVFITGVTLIYLSQPANDIILYAYVIVSTFIALVTSIARIKLTNAFAASLIDLEDKNKVVDTLIRVLIHDLMTPIMFIRNHLSLQPCILKSCQGKCSEELDSMIEIIDKVRQLKMVKDGKANIVLKEESLKGILSETIDDLTYLLESKALKVNLSSNSDKNVICDKLLMRKMVLPNILSNAIKFSSTGSNIDVTLENQRDSVLIKIRDYGVGMPQEIVDNVFAFDKKTSRTGTAGELGSGYGLPITAEFLHKMGGNIRVKSSEKDLPDFKRGTEFEITFMARVKSNPLREKIMYFKPQSHLMDRFISE